MAIKAFYFSYVYSHVAVVSETYLLKSISTVNLIAPPLLSSIKALPLALKGISRYPARTSRHIFEKKKDK